MTHFVRFALIGAMAAGASIYALAQDDDLDALLNMLEDETAEEVAADDAISEDLPTQDVAVADDASAAEAEEPVADEEPIVEEEELVEDDEPLADEEPTVEEVAEEPIADEPVDEVAEEPIEEVAAEDPIADEASAEETPVAEDVEETVETVTEEPVAEDEPVADDAPEVEEVVEETVTEEPVAEEAPAEATPATEDVEETVEMVTEEPATEAETSAATTGLLAGMEDTSVELAKETEEARALNDLEMLMRLKNKGIENHALACLNRARELMKTPPPAGKEIEQYQNAIKMYDDAAEYLGKVNRDDLSALRDECADGVREAQYRQARTHFKYGEFDQALSIAQVVQRAGHVYGDKLIEQIMTEQNRPAEFHVNPILPEYAKDEYKAKRLVIMERMQRATTYYHLAKYKDANDQLELILRDDPSNEEAINLRQRIERRDAQRARELKYSSHAEMIRQVEENWTPIGALGRNAEELYTPTVSKGEIAKVDDDGKKEAAIIMEKLNYIRLPEFSIRPPSTLADAVQIFAEASKAYDKPELPPEEKGISFVLNMGSTPAADTSSSESEEEDMFASEESASSGGLPPIQNINMPWVTLKDALDMVCEVTGSKYVIKGKTVLVVPKTYVDGKMETRSYNVMATIAEKVNAINSEMSAGSEDSGGWDVGGGGSADAGGATDSGQWKKLFSDLGVPFEGKASIVYLPSVGKLRVTNTPENLALFENILEELNVTPYQIEVEARFVEVSQTDMNSLGFEWQLNSDVIGTVGSGIDWASSSISNNANSGLAAGGTGANGHVFRHSSTGGTGDGNFAVHGGANALNQGMRFLGDSSTYANRINLNPDALAPNDQFATFSAVFGKMDMTMILHMLAQRTDTDMLSSPKVLARPTQEAMIRVVTEWIYPTEFDITELDNDDNNNNNWGNGNGGTSLIGGGQQVQAPPVKFAVEPQSFEKQEVGVSLTVVPEVSQEGQMINLLVNPKVVEFLENFDYGMDVPYVDYGMTGSMVTSATIKYYKVKMPQPKFHFREINTYLSVYNGATVVMGGLITEKRNSFEDKVPILGDLPFIGFLFRSSGEFSEKRNLLIFLTARLVDPAGRPLKTATDGRTGASAMDAGTAGTMSSTVQ